MVFRQLNRLLADLSGEDSGEPETQRMKSLLSKSGFYALVAQHGNTIIGGLTAYEIENYRNDRSELFIYEMGVLRSYRGQGVTEWLIDELTKKCIDSSVERIFLCVKGEGEETRSLYQNLMGQGQVHTHFSIELDGKA